MNNKRGFAPIVLLVILLVIGLLGLTYYITTQQTGTPPTGEEAMMEDKDKMEAIESPEPVSDDVDTETIEEELEATVVGEFEADIEGMEQDANSL